MLSSYEQFAVTSMMGSQDTPPRANGGLCFGAEWERQAFGIALALARDGHFEWEEFRQQLIAAIGHWEDGHVLADPSWNYYDRWLQALEAVLVQAGLATPEELAALPTPPTDA